MLCLCVPVFASTAGIVSGMTDENTYIDEAGNVYTYQNDKVYQIIDGKPYEVVTGSSQSIIDVMKQKPGSDKPDAEIMGQAQGVIGQTIGLALSCIIYVFFAMTAFTTACDLAYIGIPSVRSLMYEPSQQSGSMNMYGNNRVGQVPGSNGLGGQQGVASQNADSQVPKGRCFISNELKSLVRGGQLGAVNSQYAGMPGMQMPTPNRNIMLMYLKRRAVGIVLVVVVFMLLITSTVFTDFGLNIGNMIYRYAAKLLGF